MYWFGHGPTGWGVLPMMLVWLGFWALAVAGVVLAVRGLAWPARERPGDPPERLLAERYARGEIDDEEYRRRLDALRRG
jgi:putative membrane protein